MPVSHSAYAVYRVVVAPPPRPGSAGKSTESPDHRPASGNTADELVQLCIVALGGISPTRVGPVGMMTHMDLLRDLWSNKELMSALLGALIGGIVTFGMALYQARKSLEALRLQGAEARKLAKNEREATEARQAGLLIMDLLLAHRSGLRESGTDKDWLEEQEPVVDRIRSYVRILPEGEHRDLLLDLVNSLKRKRPVDYHKAAFKNDLVFMSNAALVVIGGHLNDEQVQRSPKLAEIRGEWDKAAEEHYNRMLEAAENEPPHEDLEDDSNPAQSTPSASA
ncbi:hypothetical protein ACFVJ4_38150 [Streptomyces sp. NPDC127178]|uniref:hypothetical protein n=1 Tax=unclassified Streptomyces TaxID=2593676 RepID=UPI00363C5B0E